MLDKTPTYEMFAVALLLSAPSNMNIIWTSAKKEDLPAAIETALNEVPLTDATKTEARDLMVTLSPMRTFFRGVAVALRDSEYAGDEPHPDRGRATAIVLAAQKMDQGSTSGS